MQNQQSFEDFGCSVMLSKRATLCRLQSLDRKKPLNTIQLLRGRKKRHQSGSLVCMRFLPGNFGFPNVC